MRLDTTDPRVLDLLAAWGSPYAWGKGEPNTSRSMWPRGPWDCSGWAQAALVFLGALPETAIDRSAAALAMACDPVAEADAALGDLAFYGRDGSGKARISHVTVCLGGGVCIGANGGGSSTHADNPAAYVKLERLRYRSDLVVIGRLKAEFRA